MAINKTTYTYQKGMVPTSPTPLKVYPSGTEVRMWFDKDTQRWMCEWDHSNTQY